VSWFSFFPSPCSGLTGHSRKYRFQFEFTADDFLAWNVGKLRKLHVGYPRKVPREDAYETHWKELEIPIIYVQLIAQLVAEDLHGNYNNGHEALRRQSYARRVLDLAGKEFVKEFNVWKEAPTAIRFKVLHPILLRYLRGCPDGYTPSIRSAISGDDEPSIREATEFYLSKDPVDLDATFQFRRNLVYIPESRWYLAILLEVANVDSVGHFDKVRVNHDNIMEELAQDEDASTDTDEVSFFNEPEVRAILNEGLEGFFGEQLEQVVRTLQPHMHRR